MLAGVNAAFANCYEVIGCDDSDYFARGDLRQLSCQSLWEVRNWIYKQNGYCFSTQRAKASFGNAGCWITDQGQVKLNVYERENVATIAQVEKAKGCN
ncbi:YARHG domain-containing protein [Nostoc sp. 3335mG]|nr:YARHG domain-containing protein [Nostoc sp. 3335mG]